MDRFSSATLKPKFLILEIEYDKISRSLPTLYDLEMIRIILAFAFKQQDRDLGCLFFYGRSKQFSGSYVLILTFLFIFRNWLCEYREKKTSIVLEQVASCTSCFLIHFCIYFIQFKLIGPSCLVSFLKCLLLRRRDCTICSIGVSI